MSRDAYGHLCTVTGALWTPRGRSFDGVDDYIDCGNDVSLDITDAITIEAWVKLNVIDTLMMFAGRDDGTNRNYYVVVDTDNRIDFTTWRNDTARVLHSDTVITAGQWYHVVATYNGINQITYLDGSQDCTPVTVTGNIDNDDVSFTIGARENGADRLFNGLIDEVRIYNRALSPLEVQHNYLSTKWRYR
jgi:hypothetical protein